MARRAKPQSLIPEYHGVTQAQFRAIVQTARPAVFRGLVSDWPAVKAAAQSIDALAAYLARFDQGRPIPAVLAPATAGGRLFYNGDLTGFNFRRVNTTLADAFRFFKRAEPQEHPDTLVIQSIGAQEAAPGFEAENSLEIFGRPVEPRLWIGSPAIVAAHYDASENVACAIAGRRRFTLFAPDQVANLYPGPLERTPAGAVISMVDFDEPDLARFPRFPEAMAAAWVADLEPGDAIYIPYLWWHHVRSSDRFNMLVNYWPGQRASISPNSALMSTIVAMKTLSQPQREAWSAMFDHFAFERNGPAAEHLPPNARGILGRLTPALVEHVLARLNRQKSPRPRGRAAAPPQAKEKPET